MKPREALVQGNGSSVVGVDYPPQTKELDYEVELVVLIGKNGSMVPKEKALEFVSGLGVGIDLPEGIFRGNFVIKTSHGNYLRLLSSLRRWDRLSVQKKSVHLFFP